MHSILYRIQSFYWRVGIDCSLFSIHTMSSDWSTNPFRPCNIKASFFNMHIILQEALNGSLKVLRFACSAGFWKHHQQVYVILNILRRTHNRNFFRAFSDEPTWASTRSRRCTFRKIIYRFQVILKQAFNFKFQYMGMMKI